MDDRPISGRSLETQTKVVVKAVEPRIGRNPLRKQKNHGSRNSNTTKNHVIHIIKRFWTWCISKKHWSKGNKNVC